MLFFGTLMDTAQMFSPLLFTFKIAALCGAAKTLCHCDAAQRLVEFDKKLPSKTRQRAWKGDYQLDQGDTTLSPISISKLPFPLRFFEPFLLV